MKRFGASTLVLAVVSALLLFSGCGRPVFTDLVRQRYALTAVDLRRIQFFTSDEIVLSRELDDQEKSVSGNELAIRGGVRIEEVVIPSRTPCVAVRVEGNFVLVSFAPNQPDRSLWFGLRHTDGDAPTDGRPYVLMPLSNSANEKEPFKPEFTKGFLVTYGGRKFRVKDGKMWSVHLLYDLEESFDQQKIKEEPPGWRINDKAQTPVPAPAAGATSATANVSFPQLPPAPSAPSAPLAADAGIDH